MAPLGQKVDEKRRQRPFTANVRNQQMNVEPFFSSKKNKIDKYHSEYNETYKTLKYFRMKENGLSPENSDTSELEKFVFKDEEE